MVSTLISLCWRTHLHVVLSWSLVCCVQCKQRCHDEREMLRLQKMTINCPVLSALSYWLSV